MKTRASLLVILLMTLAARLGAADAVGVAGAVVLDSGQTIVRLVNQNTKASAWVRIGDTFATYTVTAFETSTDGRTDTVVLTSGNRVLRLQIAVPRIASTVAETRTTRNGPPGAPANADSGSPPSSDPPASDNGPPAPPEPPDQPPAP